MIFIVFALYIICAHQVCSTWSLAHLGLHINLFVFSVLRKRPEEEEPKVEPKKVEKVKKPEGRNRFHK